MISDSTSGLTNQGENRPCNGISEFALTVPGGFRPWTSEIGL